MAASEIWGREAELAEVVERLRARRLVTLTGPGGIGKTVLARAAASVVAPEFAFGVVAVDLTRVDHPDGVAEAIAGQLGYADFESLLDSPGDQPALVLVDNCEHVLDAAADAIAAMLDACQMPTVIATSRSPLDVPHESIFVVGPLDLPSEGSVDTDGGAIHLLVERIRDQGADPSTFDPADLVAICRRLDGVPLALELAAARLRTISPTDLLAELDERPHALARRRFRGQSNHRSVAELVGWSTELLDDRTRTVFERLGVFAGPFTSAMAAAVAVADISEAPFQEYLDELVESSLVVADASADHTWYRLLHPIRAVALENLRVSGGLADAQSRFVDQVVTSAVEVIGRTTQTWGADALPDLIAMYDNIAASIRWLIEHDPEPDRALTLLAVLWGLVHQTHTAEIARLGEVVITTWDATDAPMWPDAAATVATCRTLTGRYDESIELATRTLESAERSIFAPVTLRRVLAQTHRILGDPERSITTFEAGAVIAAERGVHGFALELWVDVGAVLAEVGRHDDGLQVLDRTLDEAIARGASVNEAWAAAGRSHVLLDLDPSRAEAEAQRAYDRSVEIDYPAGRSCSLRVLGRARLAQDDLSGASKAVLALLDELLTRGGLHDLRLVTDVAAEILRRAGNPRWVDLAATSRALPITTVMVPIEPSFGAPDDGVVLTTRDAYTLTRSALREVVVGHEGTAVAPVVGDDHLAAMTSEGDVIRVEFGGAAVRMTRSKGLVDLAYLLAHPGQDVSCLDLMDAGVRSSGSESEQLDAIARRNYEERVRELAAEIEEAEADNDLGTAERLRTEMDFVVDELTAALGLGGRSRTSASPAERARSAVTQRLRSTLKRLAVHHPDLGEHLDATVSTGAFCRYSPTRVRWTVTID